MRDKANFKINIVVSLIYQIVVACSGFILPKFFITQYGSAINGSIATISQITGFLGLLEAGMGSVANVAFYRALAEDNSCNLTVVRNTVKRYYQIIAGISISVCVLLAFLLPLALDNGESFAFNFQLVIIVSCGFFIQYYFGITSQLLLVADYKAYVNSLTQILAIVLNFVVSIALIQNEVDIRIVKLASATIMLVRPVILSIYTKRKYSFLQDKTFDNSLMKQRWNNFGQSIAFYIHTQTDMIVIMLFLTVAENSVYAVYMSIISAIKTVITAVVSNYNPIIGRACAKKDITIKELLGSFWKFTGINNFLINILFSVTVVLIIPFMKIYSEGFDYNYIRPELAILLCASEYIYLFRTPYNTLINVNGHFKETQVSAFIEAGLNIALSIALVNVLGISGIVIATAVAMIYRTVYCVIYVKRHLLNISLLEVFKTLISTGIMVMCVFVVYSFADLSWVNNYLRFVLAGGVFTLAFTAIQLIINILLFKSKERQRK